MSRQQMSKRAQSCEPRPAAKRLRCRETQSVDLRQFFTEHPTVNICCNVGASTSSCSEPTVLPSEPINDVELPEDDDSSDEELEDSDDEASLPQGPAAGDIHTAVSSGDSGAAWDRTG